MIALLIVVGVGAWWLGTGANRGWTKTSVATMRTDPITQIDYPVYEDRFVPGVDLVAAAVLLAGVLSGLTFLVPNKKENPSPKNSP